MATQAATSRTLGPRPVDPAGPGPPRWVPSRHASAPRPRRARARDRVRPRPARGHAAAAPAAGLRAAARPRAVRAAAPHLRPPPQLTPEEAKLLARGEISSGTHVAGGLAAFFLGLGVGHGIQGRWDETGWIFTVGELASIAAIIVGIGEGEDSALVVGGAVGLVVFRVWEVVDAFAGPARHNRRLRELRMRLGYPPAPYAITPFVAPPRDGAGGVAGVSVRF